MSKSKSPRVAAMKLPRRANLEYLRKLAKKYLRDIRATKGSAKLNEVQLAVARQFGFSSWRALKAHVESLAGRPRTAPKVMRSKPLLDACLAGDLHSAKELLDGGADPNVISSTPHRYRPLHRAIEHKKTMPKHDGHDAVVKLLLSRGADPKQRATFSQVSALQLAATSEPRFVALLRDRFEPLDVFHAAALGDEKRVTALLTKDRALATAKDANTWQAIHYAAASFMPRSDRSVEARLVKIVRLLLDAGADPNADALWMNKWPLRPLYFATGYANNPGVARVLMQAGADPCDYECVYHASDEAHQESLDVIEELTDPKKLQAECTWALTQQLHWGRTRGARWLLEHGADPNWVNPDHGRSSIDEAKRTGRSAAVLKLLQKYA